MSNFSRSVLGLSCVGAVGIISYVHWIQEDERKQLHLGVVRDLERQERKRENARALQEQQDFAKHLKKQESEILAKS